MKKPFIILTIFVLSINTYAQNWTDSLFHSTIRPYEELQLQTLYTDTFQYLVYYNTYDEAHILYVAKDDEAFAALICNEIQQISSDLNLNRGDIIEIQWMIDSIRLEDNKELLFFEHAKQITKLKDAPPETLHTEIIEEYEEEREEIEKEEETNGKSFSVSYPSGNSTKYTVRRISLEVDQPIITVEFWAERFTDGQWRFATSDYYYLYYKENIIQKIEDPGQSNNLLEINPHEWVTAFQEFANQVPDILDEQTEDIDKIRELLWDSGKDIPLWVEKERNDDTENEVIPTEVEEEPQERRTHWKTGEYLDEIERKKIIIPLLNDSLEIREGGVFPCIVHQLRGSSSYFEIKRRNGKYLIWDVEYNSINEGVANYLQNDLFKSFYKNEEQWQQVWEAFVKDGHLQKVLDFINEIVDDEFLDSPLNEVYG